MYDVSSGWARAHPTPAMLGHGICADLEFFWGGGVTENRETDSATNMRRKAFDSCKLFVLYSFWGLQPLTPTRPPYVDSLTRGTSSWPRPADHRCR